MPGTQGCPGSLCLQPLSPELAKTPQGLALFRAATMTFPLGRKLVSAEITSVFCVEPSCFSSR